MAEFEHYLDELLGIPKITVGGVAQVPRRVTWELAGDFVTVTDDKDNNRKILTFGDPGTDGHKRSVRAARNTNVNGALTTDFVNGSTWLASANGALLADSVALVAGDEFVFISQVDETQNGIYTLEVQGTGGSKAQARRRDDARTSAQVTDGSLVLVREGSTYANNLARLEVTAPFTLDTDPITFTMLAFGGGGGTNATQLRGVNLDNASVGAPTTGFVITYDGTDYKALAPSGLPAPYSVVGTQLRIASTAVSPKFLQVDEAGASVNGDALTIQAQNAVGVTSTGGDLVLSSGTGTTAPGTVQLTAGATLMLTIANGAITYSTSAATTGQLRLPKDFTIVGRNDAGSGNVQLLDWGAAADELVFGADTVAKNTIRSANMLDVYGNGNLLCTFARTPATLDFQTISAITYKSTGIFAFHDSGTQRNLGIFTSGSFTTEDKTLYVGTATTAPAGTDNGGSYLWAAGTNGLELRSHTFNGTTSLLGGFLALGAIPSTTATGANLTNNTSISYRNAANSGNLVLATLNGSDNITIGNDTGTTTDIRAASTVRGFAVGVGSFSFGRASGDFLRMGGTAYASTGLIRVVHNSSPIVGLDNAGTNDRSLVRWGTTTDTAVFGDDAVNAQYKGLAITMGNNTGAVTVNANSTGISLQTAGAARVTVTGTRLTLTASVTIEFASGHTGPSISQVVTATNSITGSPTLIQAQDCSGTTAVTGGALTLQAGSATGGSGTRNGGKITLAGGTGATADGDAAIKIKGADFLTCVAAATPYVRYDNHETATTVGAAGAGAALPLTPTAYLRISLAGTRFKIPYYAD